MSKRRDSLTISEDLTNIFDRKPERKHLKGLSIEKALSTVIRQMRATGLRVRTISDYELHVGHL